MEKRAWSFIVLPSLLALFHLIKQSSLIFLKVCRLCHYLAVFETCSVLCIPKKGFDVVLFFLHLGDQQILDLVKSATIADANIETLSLKQRLDKNEEILENLQPKERFKEEVPTLHNDLATYTASQVPESVSIVVNLIDFEMPIYSTDKENENGIPDLILGTWMTRSLIPFLGTGNLQFSREQEIEVGQLGWGIMHRIVLHDMDEDGHLDVVVPFSSGLI